MSITADKNRRHPAFRLGEVMGPHHRQSFGRSLAEELHRRFDAVAAEGIPQHIAALIEQLESGRRNKAGARARSHAS